MNIATSKLRAVDATLRRARSTTPPSRRPARRPPSAARASRAARAASGVVFGAGSSAPTNPLPSVPMTAALRPNALERLRDPLRARRLAVRAGDADRPQRLRRAAVDEVRDRTEVLLEALDRLVRHVDRRDPSRSPRASQSTAAAPRCTASGMNVAPVAHAARIRGERGAGLDRAAVRRDAARTRARAARAAPRRRSRIDAFAVMPPLTFPRGSRRLPAAGSRCSPARRRARRAGAAPRR